MRFKVGRVNPIEINIDPDQENPTLMMEFAHPLENQAEVDKATKIIHLIELALDKQNIATDRIDLSIGQKQFRLDGSSRIEDEVVQSAAMYTIATNILRKLDTIESQGKNFDDAYAIIRAGLDPTFDPEHQAPLPPVDEHKQRMEDSLRRVIAHKLGDIERDTAKSKAPIKFPDKAKLIESLVIAGMEAHVEGKAVPASATDSIPMEERVLELEVAGYLRAALGRDREHAIAYAAREVAFAMYDALKPLAEAKQARASR